MIETLSSMQRRRKGSQTRKGKSKGTSGVSHGNRLCSRGRGDAGARGGQAGDLYVDVLIEDHPLFREMKMTCSWLSDPICIGFCARRNY